MAPVRTKQQHLEGAGYFCDVSEPLTLPERWRLLVDLVPGGGYFGFGPLDWEVVMDVLFASLGGVEYPGKDVAAFVITRARSLNLSCLLPYPDSAPETWIKKSKQSVAEAALVFILVSLLSVPIYFYIFFKNIIEVVSFDISLSLQLQRRLE
jgi:hypothetical protein